MAKIIISLKHIKNVGKNCNRGILRVYVKNLVYKKKLRRKFYEKNYGDHIDVSICWMQ